MARNDQIIFGIHTVREAIEAGKNLDRVLIRRGEGSPLFRKLQKDLRGLNVPVQQVPTERLNRITRKNHQGVVAWLSEVATCHIESVVPMIFEKGEDPLILVLDRISDVRNFGAIARTAECAGVHAIVIPVSGSAAMNADAFKTSAGALHRMRICRHKNLADTVKYLKESGLRIIAASEKSDRSYFEADLKGPVALMMGSEDRGISGDLLKKADQLISIPMKGKISSLNVSVAAGVLIYEIMRQRRVPA